MQFSQWIASNWQAICGWGGGLYLTYHFCRLLIAIVLAINAVVKRFTTAETTLSTVATNHLPHLQAEMEKVNVNLSGLRRDLSAILRLEKEDYAERQTPTKWDDEKLDIVAE